MTSPRGRDTLLTEAAAGAAVTLRGLRKAFGPVVAVNQLDLSLAPGEVVALLGPNGAGKSTTIDMLLGLTRPDSGDVLVFGRTPAEAIRAGLVGAMLQSGGFPGDVTVGEAVGVVGSLHRDPLPVAEVLARANVADLAKRRVDKLSGGQLQRVRFALALVSDPDLLVLDEPTAGLDVESRRSFWEAMRAQTRAGKTVLFATHYLEEADDYADRIVLVKDGQIVADGPATEIKALAGGRTIRATLPGADLLDLAALPGVSAADVRGDAVVLACSDSDTALRALLAAAPAARDLEVTGAGLEDAFVALTTTTTRTPAATATATATAMMPEETLR